MLYIKDQVEQVADAAPLSKVVSYVRLSSKIQLGIMSLPCILLGHIDVSNLDALKELLCLLLTGVIAWLPITVPVPNVGHIIHMNMNNQPMVPWTGQGGGPHARPHFGGFGGADGMPPAVVLPNAVWVPQGGYRYYQGAIGVWMPQGGHQPGYYQGAVDQGAVDPGAVDPGAVHHIYEDDRDLLRPENENVEQIRDAYKMRGRYLVNNYPVLSVKYAVLQGREILSFHGQVNLLREVNDLRLEACNALRKEIHLMQWIPHLEDEGWRERLKQLREQSDLACSRYRYYKRAIYEGIVNANPSVVNPGEMHYPELTDFHEPHLISHQNWLLERQYHICIACGEERPYYFFP